MPTKIRYRWDGNVLVVDKWGFQVEGDDEFTFEWFKLFTLTDDDLGQHYVKSKQLQKTKERMLSLGKTPMDIMSDYLAKLWEHALGDEDSQICRHFLHRSDVFEMPLHVILTVPAMWPKYARDAMEKAARKAGILSNRKAGPTKFGSTHFITEPLAAAYAYAPVIGPNLHVGGTILVCDLGGGTGDCASYELRGKDPDGRNQVWGEAIVCDGKFCLYPWASERRYSFSIRFYFIGALVGAAFADERFKDFVKYRKSGTCPPLTAQDWKAILKQWEDIKRRTRSVGKQNASRWRIALTDGHFIDMNEEHFKDIFDAVVPGIKKLLEKQIRNVKKETGNEPAIILLVGGFGQCPYIREEVTKWFGNRKKRQLANGDFSDAVQPLEALAERPQIGVFPERGDRPWGAISKGAVESTVNFTFKTRKAAFSIGFELLIEATKEEGGEWNSSYRRPMKAVMKWVVKKGEDVKSWDEAFETYLVFKPSERGQVSYKAEFYRHDDESPPDERGDGRGFSDYGEMTIQAATSVQSLPVVEAEGDTPAQRRFYYELNSNCSGASIDVIARTQDDHHQLGALVLDLEGREAEGGAAQAETEVQAKTDAEIEASNIRASKANAMGRIKEAVDDMNAARTIQASHGESSKSGKNKRGARTARTAKPKAQPKANKKADK